MIEDNDGDRRLVEEVLHERAGSSEINTVADGVQAMEYLRHTGAYANAVRPDLILLDLNLPKMNGKELLQQIKSEQSFKKIPVIVLTTSAADNDIEEMYGLHANCYIVKPMELEHFVAVIRSIEDFWLNIVTLP